MTDPADGATGERAEVGDGAAAGNRPTVTAGGAGGSAGGTVALPSHPDGVPQIVGPYRVEGLLGRGGMGTVYRAWQPGLERPIALKVLEPSLAHGELLARFVAEARNVARLQHPHIVPVHDVGRDGGTHYFAMGLIEGRSLAEQVRERGALPPREAAAVLAPMARAVDYAHSQGVLHRDLKPANVLLDGSGRPHLGDFGIARDIQGGGLTQSGVSVGTPAYMAPEQARGDPDALGPATDVYGLGATLFECLCGRPPFQGGTPLELMHRVLTQDAPDPRRLDPGLPRDLSAVCLKCLEKDPRRRYATAGELAQDLERWLGGLPVCARPLGPARRLGRWIVRHRAPVAAGTAVLVLAVAVQVALGVARHRREAAAIRATVGEVLGILRNGPEPATEDEIRLVLRLSSLRDPLTTELLLHAVDSERNPALRRVAVRALGQLGDIRSVKPLQRLLLDDSQPHVLKSVAAHALADLHQPAARDALWIAWDEHYSVESDLTDAVLDALSVALEYDDSPHGDPRKAVLESAITACRELRLDDAERILRRELDRDPADPVFVRLLGFLLMNRDRSEEALKLFEDASRDAPATSEFLVGRYNCLLRTGRYEQALALALETAAAHPDSPYWNAAVPKALANQHRLDEALDLVDQAIGRFPNYTTLHGIRAWVLYELDRVAEALAEVELALASRPYDAELLRIRAEALLYLGRTAEGLESARAAERAHPTASVHAALVSLCALQSGHLDEAAAAADRALHLEPVHVRAWFAMGRVRIWQQRYAEAEAALQQAAAVRPRNTYTVLANTWLAVALLGQGRLQDALAALDRDEAWLAKTGQQSGTAAVLRRGVRALGLARAGRGEEARHLLEEPLPAAAGMGAASRIHEIEAWQALGEHARALALVEGPVLAGEDDPYIQLHYAIMLQNVGRLDESYEWARKVVTRLPMESQAYLARGLARLGKDDAEGALADATRALDLAPDDIGIMGARAALLSRLERHREALEQAGIVLARNPANVPALLAQARAFAALGDPDRARQSARRLLQTTQQGVEADAARQLLDGLGPGQDGR